MTHYTFCTRRFLGLCALVLDNLAISSSPAPFGCTCLYPFIRRTHLALSLNLLLLLLLGCCRPDGQKKAYVRLTPDYDALDVANKIGII